MVFQWFWFVLSSLDSISVACNQRAILIFSSWSTVFSPRGNIKETLALKMGYGGEQELARFKGVGLRIPVSKESILISTSTSGNLKYSGLAVMWLAE